MKSLQIEITRSEDYPKVTIVSFKGNMGFTSVKKISQTFEDIIKDDNFFVVAEMSEVISISSPVIGELMGCRMSLLNKNGDLVLAGLKMDILETLNALDADKIFKIFVDMRSAANYYYWEFQGQKEEISVHFPSELTFVPPIRALIRRITKQKRYSNKDAFRIETIVDEICNNAVEHGTREEGKDIGVKVIIDREKIELAISNKTDPDKLEELKKMSKYLSKPKTALQEKRGHGLTLVKLLTNDFNIDSSHSGTCVRVTKLREE
jgi:anti-sigma regulatory factor (Ser/Thr protein kinase)/anti-anti-sigma regulatory factor